MTEKFRVAVNAVITSNGKILLGKKEEKEGHPFSEKWHFPGGHVRKDEEPVEALKREIEEETGLEVGIHQIVEVTSYTWDDETDKDLVQIVYHCDAKGEAEPGDDLEEVKWVDPENLEDEICDIEKMHIEESRELAMLIKKIEKAPY